MSIVPPPALIAYGEVPDVVLSPEQMLDSAVLHPAESSISDELISESSALTAAVRPGFDGGNIVSMTYDALFRDMAGDRAQTSQLQTQERRTKRHRCTIPVDPRCRVPKMVSW